MDRPAGPRPCAEAVLMRDADVLLMRRARDPWQGAWEVPGGFCEPGEHPRDAAVRELREELGLTARPVAYLGAWVDRYGPDDTAGTLELRLPAGMRRRPIRRCGCRPTRCSRPVGSPLRIRRGRWPSRTTWSAVLAAARRVDTASPPPMLDQ